MNLSSRSLSFVPSLHWLHALLFDGQPVSHFNRGGKTASPLPPTEPDEAPDPKIVYPSWTYFIENPRS